jgi:ABC-type branched-subunit amino acid transport system ATPase component
MNSRPWFSIEGVSLAFGGLQVLDHVDLHVDQGEIVGLIGPNGAGKTTLFDVIAGVHSAARGHVWFKGTDLLTRTAHERAWLGIGRTFQQTTLFPNMSVLDCVRTAAHRRLRRGLLGALLRSAVRTPLSRAEEREADRLAWAAIERLSLGDYAKKNASELSYGTLRLTELATVLVVQPELVILDEPSSGIAQRETEALGPLLLELRAELGATFLLIEHDMPLIMGISDRIYALAAGSVLAEGSPAQVQANAGVIESYLGGSVDLGQMVAEHERIEVG